MATTGRRLCPFCATEISPSSFLCIHCGRDLHSLKLAHPSPAAPKVKLYHVVPDGMQCGIAISGTIVVHGLEPDRARKLADLLNSLPEIGKTG